MHDSRTGKDVRRYRQGARPWLTLGSSLLLTLPATAGAYAQQHLEGELRAAIVHRAAEGVRVGAYVVDLQTKEAIFAHNAELPLIPASTMKVPVMAAALVELGPGFSFETTLATNGTDLIVVGDGDPAFGDEKIHASHGEAITADLQRWAEVLLQKGLHEISGDLVIDDSIFDAKRVHPSWEPGDLGKWYAAPVGGLNFNDNCVDITVEPVAELDAPVLVSVRPQAGVLEIVNMCRSGGQGQPLLHHEYGTYEYRITGRCGGRWPFGPVAFPDPGLLFADSFRVVLARNHVRVTGGIRRSRLRLPEGSIPRSLGVVARRRTRLEDVLQRAGKDSQNLFAECMLKRTGYAWARRQGDPDPQGSWALGQEAIRGLMKTARIDVRGLVVADGSGLSRNNTCTARQLTELLAWMHGRPEGPLLERSLSVAGVDGSLRKRMRDIVGTVRAKTGTMSGVRALAGYVHRDGKAKFAFAVLHNGYKGSSTPYKESQERFCRILAAVGR